MTPAKNKNGLIAQVFFAFLTGLTETSRIAFHTMFIGIAMSVSVYLWFFTYSTISGPSGKYLLDSENDISAQATWRALEIGAAPSDRPMLIINGTSFTTSAFGRDEAIKAQLDAKTGADWRVANLATALQSPLDSVSLIENALTSYIGEPVIIVLGVDVVAGGWTAEEMSKYYAEPRIGVRSLWADAMLEGLGYQPRPKWSNYLLDNWTFSVGRAPRLFVRLAVKGPYVPDYSAYVPDAPLPAEERNEDLITKQITDGAAVKNAPSLQIYRALADRLRVYPSVKLVLMQEVPSVELINERNLGGIVVAEEARYREFAKEIGAEFWSPNWAPPLPGRAFYDHFHIGDEGARTELRVKLIGIADKIYGDLTDG